MGSKQQNPFELGDNPELSHPELEEKQNLILDDGANADSALPLPAEVPYHKGHWHLYSLFLAYIVPTTSPNPKQHADAAAPHAAAHHAAAIRRAFNKHSSKRKKKIC